ncbi:MAG: UDP-3-O-acyl-N-acetylglucosamine deacetylase [Victivallaceae bacterium]|nr:UDP-3-O-acyl-N-acetylglucosamine deacetylase [Victivallaceae bacterium]
MTESARQRTVAEGASLSGIALHTGVRASLGFRPAPENTGIVFRRIDLPGKPEVPAVVTNVVDARRGTTIARGKAMVCTVEHVMSALHASMIDNCIVEMDGPEPPICDGSSIEFLKLIESCGAVEQDAEARWYTPSKPLRVADSGTQLVMFPDEEALSISCVTQFAGCPFDPQFFDYRLSPETYAADVAPCRTFVDYGDLKALFSMGLAKGGSLDVAAVIHDGAIICKDRLRFTNEIVRHKILDIIGDMYLIGRRLRGSIVAVRPGHAFNVRLAGLIVKDMTETSK